ncbi:MAG TPA: tRNA (adenosine(37)-N6)-threonylcarbamoyltransferase complex transferase subunit TsaD [Candidatus Paceibacterota bacterium]|nr:tRNA (adenosine(37)-N6)-threonylcarbamoyltransferase complex transferase subunit TsaD [Candidatus Paceibacterota bacterium]
MKILGIETSCDETALAIVEAEGGAKPHFKILAEALNSQTKIHEKYGGVFPMMAKREHAKNLIPLLKKIFDQSEVKSQKLKVEFNQEEIEKILEREPELLRQFLAALPALPKPDLEAIAVTVGPGLEPALWVGINFAKVLGIVWDLPVVAVNHMEGHILSVLLESDLTKSENSKLKVESFKFPAVALLISGGHTELVLMKDWQKYEILGQTRDDAVGEAFDKVARMMELPYPGGPEISKLAEEARARHGGGSIANLPRPMIKSKDYDFSFAGLKTAVLYRLRSMTNTEKENPNWKVQLAREFEEAVTEVLVSKTKRALEEFGAKTLIVGGGVIANKHIREAFQALILDFPDSELLIPHSSLSTDNAVMIAVAGYFNYLNKKSASLDFKATGNLALK